MASFFDTLKKLFKGEPVFPVQMQQNGPVQAQSQEQGGQTPAVNAGPKVIPQVMIERWLCTEQAGGMICEIFIRNYSQGGVVLDRIDLLGTRDHLGNHLDKGENYEYHFKMAKRPTNTHLDECDLYFKNEEGDYFLAKHQIEFEKQPDGSFSILRFRLLPPIRDV